MSLSRRRILTVGAMGTAGVASTTIAAQAQSNSQKPAPQATVSSGNANKVVR